MNAANSKAEIIFQKLSVREKAGQLLMPDLRCWGRDAKGEYIPLTVINPSVKRLISENRIGGVDLFRDNLVNPGQIIRLLNDFQDCSEIPMLFSVDQEGGMVTRVQSGTDMPGNMALGAARDPALVEEVAYTIGKELHSLGIHIDLAPTVDVNSNPANPIIGVRSFGSSPELVAELGIAYVKGLKRAGVLSCIKHFPGHGDAASDTHHGLVSINRTRDEMFKVDLYPFIRTIEAGADTVMTAHITAPSLDDSKSVSKKNGSLIAVPSTLSTQILTGLLREKLNFKGLIITDALDMKAISDHFGVEESVIKSIEAGADIALMPLRVCEDSDMDKLSKLIDVMEARYHSDVNFRRRVDISVMNVLRFKESLGLLDRTRRLSLTDKISKAESIVACREHKQLEKKAADLAVTLIKNDNRILPFTLRDNSRLLVISDNGSRAEVISDELKNISRETGLDFSFEVVIADFASNLEQELKNKMLASDFTVLATYNLNNSLILPEQAASAALSGNKKLAVISCRNPYDIAYVPSCKANVAIYGVSGFDQTNYMRKPLVINMKSGLRCIFRSCSGQGSFTRPGGRLPVDIPSPATGGILYPVGHGLTMDS